MNTILTIFLILITTLLIIIFYSKYKFKIKLFFKLHFKNRKSKINPIIFEDSVNVYYADDDIIEGIEQFKTTIINKINDATNTILNVIISEYPILVYKSNKKHLTFNETNANELINFIDTLTGTNYAILQQMPNKLRFYINQPSTEKQNLFRYKAFKDIIHFFPNNLLSDFINYIYVSFSISNNSFSISNNSFINPKELSEFMSIFTKTIKKDSQLINYCSRTLIFKLLNSSKLIKILCYSSISDNPSKFELYDYVKPYLKTFKQNVNDSKSLIIILDSTDNIIFTSKNIITSEHCEPLQEITTKTIFENNDFKSILFNLYSSTKDKKMLYILIVIIKLINQIRSDEFNERINQAIMNIDNEYINKYYSTEIENYLYMLFKYYSNQKMKKLIELFKITIPKFEITTSLNGVECLDEYDLREKDVNDVIKILNLLKYAKYPKSKTIIISDYSKTTAYMKIVNHKLVKEDIYYEDFMELKRLVFMCYKIGVKIKIINIVSNHFFKIYFTTKQYLELHELDHNIFPIDYNHFNKDLDIYQNLNTIIEFVNLKSKYPSSFLGLTDSVSYDSLFNDIIMKTYTIIAETKKYIPDVDNIKYIEFNIRNPLVITPNSIWKYPKLLNDTMLFDLTGKFSIAAKFLYSIFVDSSSLSKEVEKYKELFYEIGIEMDITNFEK